ncbi:creatininase family protein [soil metagenome]
MSNSSNGITSIFLEDLTWPEVELALTRGMTGIVVPLGAVEQHGPHLPLSSDADRSIALALRVAHKLGDSLVAPALRVGCSEFHMSYAGTVSLRPETLEAVCTDYATSLARHGFTDILFLSAHGGNFKPLREMLTRIRDAVAEVRPACRVDAYTDLVEVVSVARWVVEEETGLGNRVGGHADIAESSEMLHLRPEFVRMELAEEGTLGELGEAEFEGIIQKGFHSVTANGILGDARGMRADLGEKLLDATARVIAQGFIEEDAEEQDAPGSQA